MTTYEKTSPEEVEAMLHHIDPDLSRSDWIRVGQALKAEFGEEGCDLFENWSRQGTKYREGQFRSDWKALGRGTGRPVTLGTVFHLAKMGGYCRKPRANSSVEPKFRSKPISSPSRLEQERATSPTSSPKVEPISDEDREDSREKIIAEIEATVSKQEGESMRAVARYEYSPSFYIVRLEGKPVADGKPKKTFRPIHFDENSQVWNYKDPPKKDGDKEGYLPLYGASDLATLQTGETVYIVEGEKCVEAMRSIGRVAVTPSHGAQSPKRSDWSILQGRSVVVLPDADEDGAKYGREIVEILRRLDCEVRVVNLKPHRGETVPPKYDVADWIDGEEECEDLGKRLDAIIADSPPVVQRGDRSVADLLGGIEKTLAKTHGRAMLGVASRIYPRLDKALDGWRGFGILLAKPNIGKTNLLLSIGRGIVEFNADTVFVFFTLEMPSQEILYRALCQTTGLDYKRLRKGDDGPLLERGEDRLQFTRQHREQFENGLASLRKIGERMHLVEREDLGENFAESFEAKVRSFMVAKKATRAFVAVDHLAKIPSDSTESIARDDDRVNALLRAQRSLGEECCVVAISEARKTDFATPSMESAKGSSEISYSPDFMLSLKNESDGVEDEDPRRLVVDILKGRAGMSREKIVLSYSWKEQKLEEEVEGSSLSPDKKPKGAKG